MGFISGLHPNTVSQWVRVYKTEGHEGLLTKNDGTNKSELEAYTKDILSSFSENTPFLYSLWSAFRVFIKGSGGRIRINVLGAVNAITIVPFLKMLKEKYPDKPIALILDNASYQHCFVVKMFAASLGMHLLFLPPYSPNLNIIEKLWRFTKKKILYAKYYDKSARFHSAIQEFFRNINQEYQPELMRLFSLRFQFFDQSKPIHLSLVMYKNWCWLMFRTVVW